jgi:hypothetical protein
MSICGVSARTSIDVLTYFMCVSAHKAGTTTHCICRQNEQTGGFFHSAWLQWRVRESGTEGSAQRHSSDQKRTRPKRVAFDLVSKRLQKTLVGIACRKRSRKTVAENRSWKT